MGSRISDAQLERAVGGARELLRLADRNGTGNPADANVLAFIADVKNDANGEVNSYIGLAVDPNDPALDTAPILIRYECAIAAKLAWQRGGKGLACPKNVQDEYDWAMGELQKIADRKKGLGLPARPAASQLVQQVTKTDSEPYFSPCSPRKRYDGWS